VLLGGEGGGSLGVFGGVGFFGFVVRRKTEIFFLSFFRRVEFLRHGKDTPIGIVHPGFQATGTKVRTTTIV
jgi:hypothetical protein